jgi:hypothetical protein
MKNTGFIKLGLFIALVNLVFSLYFIKLKFFIFLTCWCLVIHTVTLYRVNFGLEKEELTRKLLIVSWTIGWVVTIMFWVYIFPIIDGKLLPPVWNYVCTHGLIHIFIVAYLYENKIHIEIQDFKWPFLLSMIYMFLMVLPLKYFGIIIYPMFFDELVPTLVILLGSTILGFSTFFLGYSTLNTKKKHN